MDVTPPMRGSLAFLMKKVLQLPEGHARGIDRGGDTRLKPNEAFGSLRREQEAVGEKTLLQRRAQFLLRDLLHAELDAPFRVCSPVPIARRRTRLATGITATCAFLDDVEAQRFQQLMRLGVVHPRPQESSPRHRVGSVE